MIPESVQSVGKYAFCDCPGLYAVLFKNPECEIVREASTISNKVSASNKDFYKGIIFGEEGSTAEKYAKKFGYGFETTENFYIRQQDLREQAAKIAPETSFPEDAEIFSPEDLNTETEAAEVSRADKNKKDKKKPEDSEE